MYPPREEEARVIFLLLKGKLTEWEEGFLKSINTQRVWSGKQYEIYKKIENKYFPKRGPDENSRSTD